MSTKASRTTDLLRPALPEEVEALTDLWYTGWRDGHDGIVPAALYRHRTRPTFHDRLLTSLSDCFVTGPVGAPDGFVRLKGAELDQFYVAPPRRGTGHALTMMRAAEHLLRGRGVDRAHLIATAGNDRACRFYDKAGWTWIGPRMEGVETPEGPFMLEVVRFERDL